MAFAIIVLRLDLLPDVPLAFFGAFLAAACLVKAGSAYLGARLARQSARGALNLAVAMNARGGPGIVLAALAFDAKLIDRRFYVSLVLLAILTSLAAGSWLHRVVRRREPLL